jgi:hypothetical protein
MLLNELLFHIQSVYMVDENEEFICEVYYLVHIIWKSLFKKNFTRN